MELCFFAQTVEVGSGGSVRASGAGRSRVMAGLDRFVRKARRRLAALKLVRRSRKRSGSSMVRVTVRSPGSLGAGDRTGGCRGKWLWPEASQFSPKGRPVGRPVIAPHPAFPRRQPPVLIGFAAWLAVRPASWQRASVQSPERACPSLHRSTRDRQPYWNGWYARDAHAALLLGWLPSRAGHSRTP